jgi:hypothetical protein
MCQHSAWLPFALQNIGDGLEEVIRRLRCLWRHPTHHSPAGIPLPNADFLVEIDLLPLRMAGALQLSEVLLDRHPKFTDFSAGLLIIGILTAGKIEADQRSFASPAD